MLNLTRAPQAIQDLIRWLEGEGFSVVHEQSSGQNNQYAVMASGSLRVEITADRGIWSLALGAADMNDSFHPDEWEAWLDDFPLAGDLSDLDHQIDFIRNRWRLAVDQATADPDAESRIHAIGSDYMQRRFGLSPRPRPPAD